MHRRVKLLSTAQCDLRSVLTFITRNVSHASAEKWNASIVARIGELATTADEWPEADESALLPFDLRMMLHNRQRHVYRILYEIKGDVVQVHRVRHAAQDALTADDFE